MANLTYPESQRENLVRQLEAVLVSEIEDNAVEPDQAFLRVALRLIGYDPVDGYLTDGKGDWGFDYVYIGDGEATVVQSKSTDFSQGIKTDEAFGPDKITDIERILGVLRHLQNNPENANEELKNALKHLRTQINRWGQALTEQTKDVTSHSRDEPQPDNRFLVRIILV